MIVPLPQTTPPTAPPGPSLRDIHLPPNPSWWPPAPGWWIAAALVLVVVALASMIWRRRQAVLRQRRRIVAQLDDMLAQHELDGDPVRLTSAMHQLLRRVARQHEPKAARQRGEAWQQTLSRIPIGAPSLQRLFALEQAVYRPPHSIDHRADAVAVRQWLQLALRPGNWKKQRGRLEKAGERDE